MRGGARALLVLLGLTACRTPPPSPQAPPPTPIAPPAKTTAPEPAAAPLRPESPWALRTLAGLSLAEKAAQLIGVRMAGLPSNPEAAEARKLRERVSRLGVGALVVFESEAGTLPRLLNDLQAAAPIPLLVAADLERGVAFRIRRGVVPLPYAMAVGATRSEEDARFTGEVTAREGRALGIHWAFAPVADVNNNPGNPVINIRSYGEDPELVARLSAAFVSGCRAGGLLTTAKHFPGHGDTAVDTHLRRAQIDGSRERLEAVELKPFRRTVEAGVDAVMMGHIAVPALDPSRGPATLSARITDLLRRDLGFDGLVVTDAMDMGGASGAWTGEAAILAVQAGADMILLPPDAEVAVKALVRSVREGQLSEQRLDASVLRILEAKERLNLHEARLVDLAAAPGQLARPQDLERAMDMARRSITVVRNEREVLPLHAERRLALLHLVLSSDLRNRDIQGVPEEELEARRIPAETVSLGPEVADETIAQLVARSAEFSHVLASAFVRVTGSKGTADMSPSHARLLRALQAAGRPVIVISFGSPYLLRQFPESPVYVCAYGSAESSQRAALGALFGEYAVSGRLPVTLPGLYAYGHGLELPRHDMTLRRARPDEVGFGPEGLTEADGILARAVSAKAFPGGVLAVGKDGALVHVGAFGRLGYESDSPEVTPETIYDLGSLTKVLVPTTVAMMLADQDRLDLDRPVRAFLPKFRGGAREQVTLRHLLTHSSGLDWWAPLYKELAGQAAYVERISAMEPVYEPGSRSLYSDLGMILLGEILERVAGESLEAFSRTRIFEPLGMRDTRYRPAGDRRARIAPTEQDAWRGRLLQGEVHDENAYALGGAAPHAGVFGTAPDLARFAQMVLNGGVYDHKRFASREIVEAFTRRCGVPGSSRALGWDTPSQGSSAGARLSADSFGHTGFTGTSLWIDPHRQLFVILLTNRVHPTRANDAIRQVRPAVADAVVRALVSP